MDVMKIAAQTHQTDTVAEPLADRRIPKGSDWLSRAELEALTPEELVRRTTALKPLVAAHALECERLRRPVDTVWNAIRKTGVFYHFVPKRYGGLEFDIDSFIDAMLPIAEGCGSTGWVAAFCVEHNWMLSQFPEKLQDETFGGAFPYIIAPGATNPPGKAQPAPGGYRLSGRWKWGTGVMHADWVMVTGTIPGETPPRQLFFALPADEVEVLDTWHVDGMIGTGSNDIRCNDVFVPEHRVMDMGEMRNGNAPGARIHAHNPIYRMPMTPFLAITAAIAAVGVARSAVDHFKDRIGIRTMLGTTIKQNEKASAHMRLGEAAAKAATAEMILRAVGRRNLALTEAAGDGLVESGDRIALRAQVALAMELCRDAVRLLVEGAGSSAHMTSSPLQRALRDINVMASHVVYDFDAATELLGRSLIDLPPNTPVF
jgi:alkylation response protein AidB-like acyl-CoA dehydrogenase